MPLSHLAHTNLPPTPPPDSIVKPYAMIYRLRPVKLTAIKRRLGEYHRLIQAIRLYGDLFPEEFQPDEIISNIAWEDVLRYIHGLAEQHNWFPVDWALFNSVWASHGKSDDKYNHELVKFLDYMPVKSFGSVSLAEYPPLNFFRVLLSDNQFDIISPDILLNLEIFGYPNDIWSEAARMSALERLHQIETNPTQYPESIQWLPNLAKWASRTSGNIILDRYGETAGDLALLPFTWRDDLDSVKQAWKQAQLLVNVQERLMACFIQDTSRLVYLCDFLLHGENGYRLNW